VSWAGPVAALLTGVALIGVLAPFVRPARWRTQRLASQVEDERLRVLRALRDLERDHDRGALEDADYEPMRHRMETQAAALLRDLGGKEPAVELASAMRGSRARKPARGGRRAGPSSSTLVAALAAVAVGAAAIPLLGGALAARSPGGFVTGAQPTPVAAGTSLVQEQQVRDRPDDLGARLDLAQAYLEAGRPKDASRQYVEVLKRDPGNPEATTRLALLLYEAGDADDALRGVDKVLATHADYPEALFLKGVIMLNALNRPKEAVGPLRRYLEVAPTGGYRVDAQQLLKEAESQGG
jgi:cytochrome c-type biogenesis protein CcmH/NrfG